MFLKLKKPSLNRKEINLYNKIVACLMVDLIFHIPFLYIKIKEQNLFLNTREPNLKRKEKFRIETPGTLHSPKKTK